MKVRTDEPLEIKEQRKFILRDWINDNSGSSDGFSPLHYSSFHGNVKSIKFLLEHGADVEIVNNIKVNVMHVAA